MIATLTYRTSAAAVCPDGNDEVGGAYVELRDRRPWPADREGGGEERPDLDQQPCR